MGERSVWRKVVIEGWLQKVKGVRMVYGIEYLDILLWSQASSTRRGGQPRSCSIFFALRIRSVLCWVVNEFDV